MILDFIVDPLSGESWENLCDSCYRMKYQEVHYQKVPSVLKGDAGIEGFTRTGVVYQCYCPEREYSADELYEHMRDKMTKDIGKLVDPDYKKRIEDLGVPPIHEWHFVIPLYKDSRILQHAETKRREVLTLKSSVPTGYTHIHDNFTIVIKVAEDF